MGEILVNLGSGRTEQVVSALQPQLPGESVVAWSSEAPLGEPEILVTWARGGIEIVPMLRPSVRWVHSLATGVEEFPFEALGDRVLTCSKGATSVPIAEFVLAAMLTFEKRLQQQWLTDPPEKWTLPVGGPLGGLAGATVAIIGVGTIGREVARRALAFGMRVLVLRRSGAPMPLPGIERAASLREALEVADHIVITAPATPDTYHLIDEGSLKWVKPGAHLVNVARGELVDSTALIAALDSGLLAHASLDVVEGEPLSSGDPLYSHSRVWLTPHISNSSHRYPSQGLPMFLDNLKRWRVGEPLEGLVDAAKGY
jgi:phosphoglycerate dehydrogenase-like enzyme